jgi:hypothetical protein
MNKHDWIERANKHLVARTGEWDNKGSSLEYCESLYETYVEDNCELYEGTFWEPEAAVEEDMTYWDADLWLS